MAEKRQWLSHLFSRRFVMRALATIAVLLVLGLMVLGVWIFKLDQDIKTRLAEKRFAPPVEFYSAPETVRAGSSFAPKYFEGLLARKNFRRREFGQPLQPGDYSLWTGDQCRTIVQLSGSTEIASCIAFRNTATGNINDSVQIIVIDTTGQVVAVLAGAQPQPVEFVNIEAELFAQYYGETPLLRDVVNLGTVPTSCLNALLAIEDSQFLEHPGISVTGLLRAVVTNLRSGRKAQGGSTITQQLVKNYFLTEEKTLRRKVTEIVMAVLVERHATKDEILETYINLIYMGQNGPFQVRGFSAASRHYFGKPLSDLNLDQCALLAAVLNSPGLYNPFTAPERALKRRGLVLDRMTGLKMIDDEQARQANASPLPSRPSRSLTEPAPYFAQAVRRELSKRGIVESDGLRVFTTLNLRAQEAAHQAVRAGLERLETTMPGLKKLKAQGKSLEAVLISADPRTGGIEALVGGRGYLATQFNRAIDSHRQVGSVMKPFVYLTAFENLTPDGKPYTSITRLQDVAATYKFEGQTWTPRNYDGTYAGEVPLYWALKESLNAPTVALGMNVGLDNIVDTARRLGITSRISPLPSLTLGAFELSPMEVLQAYSALSRLGEKMPLTLFSRIEDLTGRELFLYDEKPETVVAPEPVSELVGVMKQTLISGTGRGARLAGFTHPAAGKTGTTNDKKDSWFAGFTPYHAAIAWVGYDDNTPHNLTGGSGAVPIWTSYMKAYGSSFPPEDFVWPEGVEKITLSPEQQLSFGAPATDKKGTPLMLEPIELIFKRGQAPAGTPSPLDF